MSFAPLRVDGGGLLQCLDVATSTLAAPVGTVIAGSDTQGFYLSDTLAPPGDHWTIKNKGVGAGRYYKQAAAIMWSVREPTTIYAAVGEHGANGGLLVSVDGGVSWAIRSGVPQFAGNHPDTADPIPSAGDTRSTGRLLIQDPGSGYLFAATYSQGVLRDANNGLGNFPVVCQMAGKAPGIVTSGSKGTVASPAYWCRALAQLPGTPGTLYAAAYASTGAGNLTSGVWKCTNAQAATPNFTKLANSPPTPEDLLVLPGGTIYAACGYNGLYRSTDGGTTWTVQTGTSSLNGSFIDLSGGPVSPGTNTKNSYWSTIDGYTSGGSDIVIAGCSQPTAGAAALVSLTIPSTFPGSGSITYANLAGSAQVAGIPTTPSTTVASGSTAGAVTAWAGAAVLAVTSNTGFPATGNAIVTVTGGRYAFISYTGLGTNTLTGCAYLSGANGGDTLTIGNPAQYAYTWWNTGNQPLGNTSVTNPYVRFDPGDGTHQKVYLAVDQGFYRSLNGGATWTIANSGMPMFTGSNVAADPGHNGHVIFNDSDYGFWDDTAPGAEAGGTTLIKGGVVSGANGYSCVFDPADSTVYLGAQSAIGQKYVNALGEVWSRAWNAPSAWSPAMGYGPAVAAANAGVARVPVAMTALRDVGGAKILVAASWGGGLWRYAGAPATVAAGSSGGTALIQNIATWSAPSGAGVLAVASTAGYPAGGGTLTVATNVGSPVRVATVTYTGISGNTFTGCAYVSGANAGDTLLTGGVVNSAWTQVSTACSASTGASAAGTSFGHVAGSQYVYCFDLTSGVYRSADYGVTWTLITTGATLGSSDQHSGGCAPNPLTAGELWVTANGTLYKFTGAHNSTFTDPYPQAPVQPPGPVANVAFSAAGMLVTGQEDTGIGSGIYYSVNNGLAWFNAAGDTTSFSGCNAQPGRIAIGPETPPRIYVAGTNIVATGFAAAGPASAAFTEVQGGPGLTTGAAGVLPLYFSAAGGTYSAPGTALIARVETTNVGGGLTITGPPGWALGADAGAAGAAGTARAQTWYYLNNPGGLGGTSVPDPVMPVPAAAGTYGLPAQVAGTGVVTIAAQAPAAARAVPLITAAPSGTPQTFTSSSSSASIKGKLTEFSTPAGTLQFADQSAVNSASGSYPSGTPVPLPVPSAGTVTNTTTGGLGVAWFAVTQPATSAQTWATPATWTLDAVANNVALVNSAYYKTGLAGTASVSGTLNPGALNATSWAGALATFYAQAGTPAEMNTLVTPAGVTGVPYSVTMAASGDIAPYTWSFTGTLPPGLSLSAAGVITGTPTAPGTYISNITATGTAGTADTDTFTIVITAPSTLAITPLTPPPGITGQVY